MPGNSRTRCAALLAFAALTIACPGLAGPARAGSIFDDDYAPPERSAPQAEVRPAPSDQPASIPQPSSAPAVPAQVGPAAPPTATTSVARRIIPTKAEQTKSRKLFKEAFAGQLKNKSPAARIKLARTLLEQAAKDRDTPVDCFVLLSGALESAEEGADLNLSFSAADKLANGYQLDPLAAKAEAATKVWARPSASTTTKENVSAALGLVDQLIQDDDFATASRIEALLQHGVAASHDPKLKSMVDSHVRTFSSLRAGHDKFEAALTKLKTAPDDPAANAVAGAYYCFVVGRWDLGLPLLSRGNDEALKPLASAEIKKPSDPEAVSALADGWWDAAAQLTGSARSKAQSHAVDLYQGVMGSLPGLRRLVIEKRISEADAAAGHHVIDLLPLIDPKRDAVAGEWSVDGHTLISPSDVRFSRLRIGYQPPEEYDFRITFVRTSGNDAVVQGLTRGDRSFNWDVAAYMNTMCGFELVGGKRVDANETTKRSEQWLRNGVRYTSVVQVRRDRVAAYLDGALMAEYHTDYSDLSGENGWEIAPNGLGVGAFAGRVEFSTIELIEITGRGNATPVGRE